MTRVKNYSLELKLAEELRLDAKVPLVQVFRVRAKDVYIKDNIILFRTKMGYEKRIKINRHLFIRICRFVENKNLLPINYIFFSNSRQDPIGKSEYFTILWNKLKLGERPKISMPNIDLEENELSGFLHRELLYPGQREKESMQLDEELSM